jgi:TRAP transporter T-component
MLACACAATPPPLRQTAPVSQAGDAETHWLRRGSEPECRAALDAWRARPDDAEAHLMLARGSYFLADAHLLLDPSRKAMLAPLYADGAAHAERGLVLRFPAFAAARQAGKDVARAAEGLPAAAAPYLYWWAQNQGRWANEEGLATSIAQHRVIYPVMEAVAALEPDFWYGGPARYRAVVYAVAPPIAGGDLGKSREAFAEAIAAAPYFLETHVLLAALYARKIDDRALFDDTLRFVLATPDDAIPGLEPELAAEKRKAERLLAQGR